MAREEMAYAVEVTRVVGLKEGPWGVESDNMGSGTHTIRVYD